MYTADYIIVGQGLAGTAIAQQLHFANKSYVIIDELDPHQASRIASGIWNPVVLKRMKKVWLADAMLASLRNFYLQSEKLLNVKLESPLKVNRLFNDAEEANKWIEHCDNALFAEILNPKITHAKNSFVINSAGLGEVKTSGRIDTEKWLASARAWFLNQSNLREEKFNHCDLALTQGFVRYNDITAKGIIFCEGMHAAHQNPFFSWLPFALTKGEVLVIKSKDLRLNKIINGGVFILPLGEDFYKVGATYAWNTIKTNTTPEARVELLSKLKKFISSPFEVVDQQVGIRPTIKDRRPLLGTHPTHKNVHIFNGMGSRGVLMAPYLSEVFVNHLLHNAELPEEADIQRFIKNF